MRSANGSLRGWYVNLQAMLAESPLGFDTTDWQLDLWIPEGGEAEWKDEDDLERALAARDHVARKRAGSHARRDTACSRSGRSRPAGRTGAPTRPGRHPRFRTVGMWSEGDVICVRQTWLGRVWQAHAWYVVADGEDELVLFAPIGAEAWFSGIPIPRDEWTLQTERVQGAPAPARAARRGLFDIADLGCELDASRVVRELRAAAPSSHTGRLRLRRRRPRPRLRTRTARWKLLDEDELAEGLESGVLTAEDEAAARADAARLVEEWPFPTGWEDWRPDPRWEPPRLPAGWDVVGEV